MDMNFGQRLKEILKSKDVSQKELAAKISVDDQTMSRWITGRNAPNVVDISKICRILHISEAELFGKSNIEVRDVAIPIVSSVGATDDTGRAHFLPHEPPYKQISFSGCKAVIVESNSMAPMAYKGQKVIYCETEPVNDGDLVFVKFTDGAQLFKRYYKNHGDIVTFHSINPVESPKPLIKKPKEIEFCYKVVGIKF